MLQEFEIRVQLVNVHQVSRVTGPGIRREILLPNQHLVPPGDIFRSLVYLVRGAEIGFQPRVNPYHRVNRQVTVKVTGLLVGGKRAEIYLP